MTEQEIILWHKIEAFELDEREVGFKFSDRLARENGWSLNYAQRVVDEYKRFIFLCCVCDSGVTPSDPVDQAWHLHLTFTRSYWVNLCRDVLGLEIHHNPTKGGELEAEKFDSYYTSTHRLYINKFGSSPPADIWQNNHTRFTDINFQRVNTGKYWLVKKPKFSAYMLILPSLGLCYGFFVQASDSAVAISIMLGIMILVTVGIYRYESGGKLGGNKDNRNDNSGSGCSTAGCGGDFSSHHGSHGHGGDSYSGSESGCDSGCSSSGCSGCGSGCGSSGD